MALCVFLAVWDFWITILPDCCIFNHICPPAHPALTSTMPAQLFLKTRLWWRCGCFLLCEKSSQRHCIPLNNVWFFTKFQCLCICRLLGTYISFMKISTMCSSGTLLVSVPIRVCACIRTCVCLRACICCVNTCCLPLSCFCFFLCAYVFTFDRMQWGQKWFLCFFAPIVFVVHVQEPSLSVCCCERQQKGGYSHNSETYAHVWELWTLIVLCTNFKKSVLTI